MRTIIGLMRDSAALSALFAAALGAQQPRPGTPTATISGNAVVLRWPPAASAKRYWVQRAIGSGPLANLSTPKITDTTYSDPSAPAGVPLQYRVMAGFAGTSVHTYSGTVSVTLPAGPASTASAPATAAQPPSMPVATSTPMPGLIATVPVIQRPDSPSPPPGQPIMTAQPVNIAPFIRPMTRTPTAEVPKEFTAKDGGGGTVIFNWLPVNGAVQYRLEGTGLPPDGVVQPSSPFTASGIPAGPGNWAIRAIYSNDFSDPNALSRASAVIHIVPPHALAWLSKSNGSGNPAVTLVHSLSLCSAFKTPSGLTPTACLPGSRFADLADAIGLAWDNRGYDPYTGEWVGGQFEAQYTNVTDFATSRATRCWELSPGGPFPFPRTVCYSLSGNHGLSVIVKQLGDTWFLSYTAPRDPTSDLFMYVLADHVVLDSEGPKFAPHACLSCHGGQFDPQTGRVSGATLQPLDPAKLQFSDQPGFTLEAQENNVKGVNAAVYAALPSVVVARYIRGLYGGDPHTSTAPVQRDYVPREWASQAGLYRTVVRPYCSSCHMGASRVDFSSADNFMQYRIGIQSAVCSAHSMPHAEVPFTRFWTADTGPFYLPGFLSAALGFNSCP